MRAAVRAELRKLRTTKMWLGLTLGGVALVAFYVIVIAFTAGSARAGNALRDLGDPASVRTVYGVPFEIGYVMPLVMGIIVICGEFRHRTITPTFLSSPRRGRVLVAKALVTGMVGLAMGLVFTVVTAALGAALIAGRGYPTRLTSDGVPRMLALMVVGLGVWAIFGLGFGALLKNQVAAIVAAIALVSLVDSLLGLALRWAHLGAAAKMLPLTASQAIVQPSGVKAADLLPWWAGALVLLGWGIATAALGGLFTMRRDVT